MRPWVLLLLVSLSVLVGAQTDHWSGSWAGTWTGQSGAGDMRMKDRNLEGSYKTTAEDGSDVDTGTWKLTLK